MHRRTHKNQPFLLTLKTIERTLGLLPDVGAQG